MLIIHRIPTFIETQLASHQEISAFLAEVERRAFKQAMFAVRDEDSALDVVQDAMLKLTEKYELIEPVTRGRINSFVARDLSTSEQALVHLFECARGKSRQPAAVWVLQAFRCLAPSPPGRVIEDPATREKRKIYRGMTSPQPPEVMTDFWRLAYGALNN